MENNFDLQRLWTINNADKDSLNIGAYAGIVSLAVFKSGTNKPVIKLNLNLTFIRELKRLAKEIATANPGTNLPFIQMVYDATTKSYVKGVEVVFCKDDKRIISIEVGSPTVSRVKFKLKCKGVFSNGDDGLSEERRSVLGLQDLYDTLDKQTYEAMMLSKYNLPKFPNRTGNSGPNKQHQTSEGYRKQAESADPFKGGDDDLGDLY